MTREQLEAIVNLCVDEALKKRLACLADKSSEGALSEAEHAEYVALARANDVLSILQSKARLLLRKLND